MMRSISKRLFSTIDKRPQKFEKLAHSYYHQNGENHSKLTSLTANDLLLKRAEDDDQNNQNIAAIFPSENNLQLSWKDLYEKSTKLADSLTSKNNQINLKKGQPLAIWAPNISEWLITQFAAARAGLALVTLNPLYKGVELEQLLIDINCETIICPPEVEGTEMHFAKFLKEMKKAPKNQIFIDNLAVRGEKENQVSSSALNFNFSASRTLSTHFNSSSMIDFAIS